MKSEKKTIFLYTGISLGILLITFTLFSWIISLRINALYENHIPIPGKETAIHATRKDVLTQVLCISVLFLCIGGIPVYLVGKRYARKISGKIDQAYQSEKAFIRNASHEVNNPLTAIQGECEITLMKERTPGEYQAALKRIDSETKRMILLMKHLLFLAHGEKEMLNSSTEPIQLANLLMEYAQGRVHFSMDNFALFIEANPQLLRLALDNIIGNACKYSTQSVGIDLRGTVLQIADQGIGIPEDELEKIMQPFYRGSNAKEIAGNGIGLSLSIRIFNFYGAKVKIISKEQVGTNIFIDFQKHM
ncbi:MAG: HAMP domain-containing sensor histidine kinase [Massilibacteroides sp.]|nr:HAMP domain-containing sensor histidine kinase [Massilibacteroides sp.]MDD3061362.1 HAMP domain-containing sensor histidine kinase [Massilibacteroides sp.]MDD4116059.1 HAMP domain-containing sensor histidine kinase [Massilibacteroides sp.]MDD4659453.1 HAMP domain-containing sensor histidine kinase [Massilibacteroides sp.]